MRGGTLFLLALVLIALLQVLTSFFTMAKKLKIIRAPKIIFLEIFNSLIDRISSIGIIPIKGIIEIKKLSKREIVILAPIKVKLCEAILGTKNIKPKIMINGSTPRHAL